MSSVFSSRTGGRSAHEHGRTHGIVALFPVTPGGLGIVEASLGGLLILAGIRGGYTYLATLAYRIASY